VCIRETEKKDYIYEFTDYKERKAMESALA
jgi:hypothetical protein